MSAQMYKNRTNQTTGHSTSVSVVGTDHGAAEGRVLGQDTGSFSLGPAACPAVGLGAVGAQYYRGAVVHGGAVVTAYTVTSG